MQQSSGSRRRLTGGIFLFLALIICFGLFAVLFVNNQDQPQASLDIPTPAPTPNIASSEDTQFALDLAPKGQITIIPPFPSQMDAGEEFNVTVEIVNSQIEAVKGELLDNLESNGQDVAIGNLPVGFEMGVKLNSTNPQILLVLNENGQLIDDENKRRQAILPDRPAEWEWIISAEKQGTASLKLDVFFFAIIDGERTDFPLGTEDIEGLETEYSIDVKFNFGYSLRIFWEQNWQWLLLSLAVIATVKLVLKDQKKTVFLFLGANPDSTSGIREDKEIEEIDSAVQSAKFRRKIRIEKHFAVKFENVDNLIRRYEPRIVHFSGHGSDTYELIFEGRGMFHDTVSAGELVNLFRLIDTEIDCVVLNACFSEPLARALSRHVGCVIGTSKELGDQTAIQFSNKFYRAIADGASIGQAYKSARDLLDNHRRNNVLRSSTPSGSTESSHKPKLIFHKREILYKRLVRKGFFSSLR